ncbi:MAG: 1-acyl-sn-glycerol-3-phosphate acyltransferase [Sphingomonas sp.]|nr:1-acyl-sn-glycerol-3-phosphate acyltransferase [Sphingomonas sp.]
MALSFAMLHYVWRFFGAEPPWTRRILAAGAWIVGARVTRVGTPLQNDVFTVSNHLSWIDIMALGGASGTSFVAKAELATAPIVGWLSTLHRSVYVKREDRFGVADQIDRLRAAIGTRWKIAVFPEGTTTDGHSLLQFKTPLLRVLEPPPPGVMVQPVMIDYGAAAEEIAWIGDETGLNNAKRILSRPGTFAIRVHFLDPFDPRDFPGRKAIAAESRRRIEAALVAALGKPLRPFAWMIAPVRYEPLPPTEG